MKNEQKPLHLLQNAAFDNFSVIRGSCTLFVLLYFFIVLDEYITDYYESKS